MVKNEKVFITGGAGFLGRNLIKSLYDNNEITVFSRDESKHYFLKNLAFFGKLIQSNSLIIHMENPT